MKAVLCKAYGPPEDLVVEEVAIPDCGATEVLIRVKAAGVNFPDTLIIEGKYQVKMEPPFTPGSEVAGIIERVGAAVTRLKIGDRVMALTLSGGFAEAVAVQEDMVIPIPDSWDFTRAACFCLVYGTSMHALRQRGRLLPGETLLVLGAAGGVGLAAVELGTAMGASVIAAAGSPEKLAAARAAGASHVIDYTTETLRDRLKQITQGRGVDVIYDPVGGDLFDAAVRSLAWKGRLLVVGFASGRIPQLPVNLVLLKGAEVAGVFWGAFSRLEPDANQANFREMFAWCEEGKLSPRVDRVYPMTEAGAALRALLDRKVIGKLALKIAD